MTARRKRPEASDTHPAGPAGTRPPEPPRPGSNPAISWEERSQQIVADTVAKAPPLSDHQITVLSQILRQAAASKAMNDRAARRGIA